MDSEATSSIAALSPELYIHNAMDNYKQFAEKPERDVPNQLYNPTAIGEEIKVKKELFSKLKFQYLEQETREKFLRSILETTPLFVEQLDIDAKIEQNKVLKGDVKTLKNQQRDLSNQATTLAKEVVDLHEVLQGKTRATEIMLEDIDKMNHELNSIMQENEFLSQFDQTVDKHDDSLGNGGAQNITSVNQLSSRINNSMKKEESVLLRLNSDHGLKEELLESHKRTIEKLSSRLQRLESQAKIGQVESESLGDLSSFETKNQESGQWIKEMNDIWTKLFLDKIEINVGRNKVLVFEKKGAEALSTAGESRGTLLLDITTEAHGNEFFVKRIYDSKGEENTELLTSTQRYSSFEQIAKVIEYSI